MRCEICSKIVYIKIVFYLFNEIWIRIYDSYITNIGKTLTKPPGPSSTCVCSRSGTTRLPKNITSHITRDGGLIQLNLNDILYMHRRPTTQLHIILYNVRQNTIATHNNIAYSIINLIYKKTAMWLLVTWFSNTLSQYRIFSFLLYRNWCMLLTCTSISFHVFDSTQTSGTKWTFSTWLTGRWHA